MSDSLTNIASDVFEEEVNFTLFSPRKTANEAIATCQSLGGSLARIDSIEQFDFVKLLTVPFKQSEQRRAFWIGTRTTLFLESLMLSL